ncbi:MAG: V4R domain-containing protein [Longimicrobiales bacterium]
MNRLTTRPQELALPIASLAALRNTLIDAVGEDAAAHALRASGHAAGDALFTALVSGNVDEAIPAERFWQRLGQLFHTRGWGTLRHEDAHPGVGALNSLDWVEADAIGSALRPSCFLTTGLLANLLGRISGEEVAVLEVECRSRGDARCRFLFGSASALDAVYARVAAGESANASLAALR